MSKHQVIAFPQNEEQKDLYEMTLEEIQVHYAKMQEELHALDAKEPKNMNSDAYEVWADEHEELEDYLDEILDRMEELCK